MPPKSSTKAAPRAKKKQRTRTGPRFAQRGSSPPSSPPLVHPPSPPPTRPYSTARSHSTSHVRPPHLSYGNPSIRSLLLDDTAITRYQGFQDRPFVSIHSLSRTFLDSLQISKLTAMFNCQPMSTFLLDNHDLIFPGMVAQFFANLRFENHNQNILVSRVNRVTLRLDWQLLNGIFGTTLPDPATTLRYWDDTHLWPQTSELFRIADLRTLFSVSSREAKDFNPTHLAPVDRVIYHLLVNFINPVAGHFTNPGKVPLVYYFLFIHHTPIDWGFVVFSRLRDIITDPRRNLPHAQFLTPVFKHFNIPFNEAGIPPHAFDMSTLNKKGIRLHQGDWITRQAYLHLAQPSSSAHPTSAHPTSVHPTSHDVSFPASSSSLRASIDTLQRSVNTLLNHVRYLEHGVKMALPYELHEEFESDKILFDIASDSDSAAQDTADSSSSTTDRTSSIDSDVPLASRIKRSKMIP